MENKENLQLETYQESIDSLMQKTQSSTDGLSITQARKKLERYGLNQLKEAPKKPTWKLLLETFKDAMVIILLIVSLIQMFMGDYIEFIIIFAVLILNSVMSVVQTKKAKGSLEALKNLSAPNARVIRDGKERTIPANELVVGDIVLLEAGDYVPADGRLLEARSLKVNEGMLTGESISVAKEVVEISNTVPISDRTNMVLSGTIITYGRGKFLVTATGNNTEIGEIAGLLESTIEQVTPLQRGLDKFSKKLSLVILILSLLILCVQLFRLFLGETSDNLTADIINSVMFAVAVAVAAIPEALQPIVTIVLSLGTNKMAKRHVIIRKLPSVETLGSTSVICTDKTGTLTQNKMTVVDYYLANGATGDFVNDPAKWSVDERRLIEISVLVNDASIGEDGSKLGDPTEVAFIDFSEKLNQPYQEIRNNYPRQAGLPFDSDRKLMSTTHYIDNKQYLFVKGGPDIVFKRSNKVLVNGKVVPMTERFMNQFREQNEIFSNRALRVLAFAYRPINSLELSFKDENDLILVGLLAMIDPPREEVMQAVKEARSAGIKTIMITGDHKTTAVAIAKEIGIFEEDSIALTGTELEDFTEDQLNEVLEKVTVYARVSPENKIRIVRAWQTQGHISAMTGDGVNDAPALKQADIGIAMGTGTDVAKDASAMVLTDDNFASIVSAVEVGRNVFDNIQKSVSYLFSGNLGAIIAIIFALVADWSNPFTALQLLFINLVNDSLPAIAIGTEKSEPETMSCSPRDPNSGIFTDKTLLSIAYRGVLIGIGVIVAQWLGMRHSPEFGVAMSFSTLIWCRTLQTFSARSNTQTAIQAGFFSNRSVLLAVVVCSVLYCLTMIPGLKEVFSIPASFGVKEVFISIGIALVTVILMEIKKLILIRGEKY